MEKKESEMSSFFFFFGSWQKLYDKANTRVQSPLFVLQWCITYDVPQAYGVG